MADYTLTLLDTTGIQDYIFGSNVLRENIGASELVHRATRRWPFEMVRQLPRTNIKPAHPRGELSELDDTRWIEQDGLDAEVIYAGGGNCAILFADPTTARNFATNLSKKTLVEAPDLNLIVAHVPVKWAGDRGDSLAEKVDEALRRLETRKRAGPVSTPLLGVGTTVACQSTGLPAVGTDEGLKPENEPRIRSVSASILAKLQMREAADKRLTRLAEQVRRAGLTIPFDLDNFGRSSGAVSYIAVVHADGNSMGRRIEALRQRFPTAQDNRAYIQAMRDFSGSIEQAARSALEQVGDLLLTRCDPHLEAIRWQGQRRDGTPVELKNRQIKFVEDKTHRYLPFRPIVFGGDDITFVTDGRLGLTLAAAYLEAFERSMQLARSPDAQGLQASAGVAVVKVHYPFARAYALAANLAQNAKQVYNRQYSALDWHFAATGLFGSIQTIRERQYTTPSGLLVMRPVRLQPQPGSEQAWRSWPDFARITQDFLIETEWEGKRNKVIALRQALRDGPRAVERFRLGYGLKRLPAPLTQVYNRHTLQTTGWDGTDRCAYFDAIEALDFFLPLQDGGGGSP